MKHDRPGDRGHAVSRRTVMVLAGTAIVAAAVPAVLFTGEPETGAADAKRFVALLADPAGAAALGEMWFAESRPGTSLPVYTTRLEKRLRAKGWSPAMDDDETHRLLADCVRADYAEDRLAAIDAWALSETEADLCALAALEARAGNIPASDGPGDGDKSGAAHG
tara:strand:- start:2561 stop:3055 length:495 start_codon:yes stop_codon:yes gene_type:complete